MLHASLIATSNAVEQHWLTDLALDFTSEVLKYSVLQNYTRLWLSNDLDDYVSGLLTMGYHAAMAAMVLYTTNIRLREDGDLGFDS